MSRKESSSESLKSSGSVDKDTYFEYMDLLSNGRDAFVNGRLKDAEYFFNQALELELDVTLTTVKKGSLSSVGSYSDLSIDSSSKSENSSPRSSYAPEVSEGPRVVAGPREFEVVPDQYKGTWTYLESVSEQASRDLKVNPRNVNAYLRKAAALSLMNRWAESKDVYREGLRNCKGNQKLNIALDALNKTEALTRRISEFTPRVTVEARTPARGTPSPSSPPRSIEALLSPSMQRKNKFTMSSWNSLDNLEKKKTSQKTKNEKRKGSKASLLSTHTLRRSMDMLGSTESLPNLIHGRVRLSPSLKGDIIV